MTASTKILAISGSLRAGSSNTALLRAAQALAPAGATVELYAGLAELPHFNPDLEGHEPDSVHALRASLRAADAVLFSSPEYAHGVPGSLKNMLDWVVGSVHSKLDMPKDEMTKRIVRAIESGLIDCVGHITGRLLGGRDGSPMDLDAILEALSRALLGRWHASEQSD